MKELFKTSLGLFGRIVTINIMCFFIVISFSVLVTAAFSENIGYTAIGTSSESKESVELYKHYYKDGVDTKKADYEAEGYTITESKIRSEVSKTGDNVFLVVVAFFCTMILVAFLYPKFWQMGTKDSNLVHFKHKPEDKLKGLKCGLIAIIPSCLLLLVFYFILRDMPIVIYKFLNSGTYAFIELIVGKSVSFAKLNVFKVVLLFLLNLLIPLITYVSYLLGYKNISISEKLIYKKSKEV